MDGLGFEVLVEEGEVGVVADDIVRPDGADRAHEGMVLSEVVVVEEGIGFSDYEQQILTPFFLKIGVLDHLSYALVDKVLDLGVDVLFELILQQNDEHLQHMPTF